MVQVSMEACLPDVRVAPVKVVAGAQTGYASPRRTVGAANDPGPLYKSTRTFSRSKSLRDSAEDVYEAEYGGPAERALSRPSSRTKSRIVKDARAELLGLDDALHNVGHRELRSRSAARVRDGVDVDMDDAENGAHVEVSKSRSSSRMKSRTLRDQADAAGLHEAVQDVGERESRSVSASRTRNGVDATAEIDGRSHGGRSLQSTPRLASRTSTPRLSVRASRDQEDLRGLPEAAAGEKEPRSSAARRSLLSLDFQDDATLGPGERVSYRIPTKSPRSTRENSDLPEERLLRVERLTRKQGRSKGEPTDMQLETMLAQGERASRRNVRKAEVEGPDDEEDAPGNLRRGRVARQHKRKLRDAPRDPTVMLPVSHPPECEMPDAPPVQAVDPLPPSPTTSSRSTRETSTSRSISWLHAIGDLIMWKDVPRSALWFGAGSFVILSASFMQELQSGVVAISANLALCYLAVVFFYRTFLRGSPMQSASINSCGVTEADLLGWIRLVLPAVNLALKKAREVFSGDPATTLRVAGVLWLIAKMGSGISIWSFMRIGFFALFTLPKCHSCYSNQLYAYVQSLLVRGWMSWNAFAHKKAMLVAVFLLAWNTSSFFSRLWGGFMLIVWLKLYQQSHPASFEKALADANCSSAIDRIDRRKSLQQAMMASQAPQAATESGVCPSPQTEQAQTFPDRTVNGVTYRA